MAATPAGSAALWAAGLPLLVPGFGPSPIPTLDKDTGGAEDGDDGDGKLRNWSSLIGIVIAIVGNAMIALALNVQRYAHIRLHRERIRIKERSRAAFKAVHAHHAAGDGVQGARSSSGSYGTMSPNTGGVASDDADADDTTAARAPLVHPEESAGESESSADEHEPHNHPKPSSYLKSPYWWLGQVLITVGETGNFLAYGFAPASIVSPLGVVALIANCIIAPIFFGERFRPQDLWGVAVAVTGVVTVVLSAKSEETRLDPEGVWRAITQTPFEIYMAITVALIGILVWMSRLHGRRIILIDLGLVGLLGGYTALSTKAISSILSASFFAAFTTPLTYLLIFVMLATAILQVRYVNRALQRFDSTSVIPVQFVLFTMCVIVGSAVLYRDFERTNADHFSKFIGGCLLTFFGVFLITNGRVSHDDDDDDNDDETLSDAEGVAETIGLSHQEAHAQSPPSTPRSAQGDGLPYTPPSRRSSRASRTIHPVHGGRKPPNSRNPSQSSQHLHMPPEHPKHPISESAPMLPTYMGQTGPLGATHGCLMHSDTLVTNCAPTIVLHRQAPINHASDHNASCNSSPASPRRQSVQRQHTFISPSPLSTAVTVAVHDALRTPHHPYDPTEASALRRIRSSIRASLCIGDVERPEPTPSYLTGDHGVWASGNYQELHDGDDEITSPGGQPSSRSRSLSDTIGDLLRVTKRRDAAK